MPTVEVNLETRKLDREYAQPFIREVNYGDTIKFKAVDADFTVTISNQDGFLTLVGGGPAGAQLSVTINSGSFQEWQVATGPLAVPYKYYDVCWDAREIYADRPDASPPKIIITW